MGVKVRKMFFILMEEKKKSDLMCQLCTTKLMALLVQESKSTGTMFGLFLKLNIDLDMPKRKYHKELDCRYIQNELAECFQKLSLSRRQLKISNLSLKIYSANPRILDRENLQFLKTLHLELPEEIQMNEMLLS